MSAMKRLFQLMAEKKASDIYLSVGAPINIKINGNVMPINQQIMDSATVRALLYEVVDDRQKKEYEDTLELNTGFTFPGVGSFRISGFRQKGSPAVVVRYIPATIPPARHARAAARAQGADPGEARPYPDGGRDRLGKVDYARGHARLPQRAADRPHLHPGGSDRVRVPEQEVDREPARGRDRHARHEDRAEERAAPGARLHPHRRGARQGRR